MFKTLRSLGSGEQSAQQGLTSVMYVGLLCISLGSTASVAETDSDSTAGVNGPDASIWANTVFDPESVNGSGGLNTSEAESDDGQAPILVPLPAPILAAGTGLGLAWILRKRMSRV
jgi:hypothetical protein